MKHLTISLFFLLGINIQGNSQKISQKFSKVSLAEVKMDVYEQDPSASAVILYDKGTTTFEPNYENTGYQFSYTRHLKLKILTQAGLEYANIKVLLERHQVTKEKIRGIKGKTYNVVNGKLDATKFSKKNIYTKELSSYRSSVTIPMPAVKVGSVIDIEYQVISPFLYTIDSWSFQKKIPVKYSEFSSFLPDFLSYNVLQKGVDKINIQTQKKQYPKSYRFLINGSFYSKDARESKETWVATDVPAFTVEEHLTTMYDYVNRLNFEMSGYTVQGKYYDLTQTWEKIYSDFLKIENYGKKLEPSRKIKQIATTIKTGKNTLETAHNVYQFVKNSITWNGNYSMYSANKSADVIQKGGGNSGEINIALIELLKAKMYDVTAIALSTRDNGRIYPSFPTRLKFNYVIAQLTIDGQVYFLDATDPMIPFGMLPKHCLNGSAHKISPNQTGKIDLLYTHKESIKKLIDFTFQDDKLVGKAIEKIEGYAAFDFRRQIKNKGVEKYKEELSDTDSEIKFENLFEDLAKNITKNYIVENSENIRKAGDKIYFTPLLNYNIKSNPFISEIRKYPVDFAYPRSETIVINYMIPENFMVESIPESINMKLPNKAGIYSFSTNQKGNKLTVIRRFSIKQTSFIGDEYLALKNFYDLVVEKEKETIVLKLK